MCTESLGQRKEPEEENKAQQQADCKEQEERNKSEEVVGGYKERGPEQGQAGYKQREQAVDAVQMDCTEEEHFGTPRRECRQSGRNPDAGGAVAGMADAALMDKPGPPC